jgi:hypothetical protein
LHGENQARSFEGAATTANGRAVELDQPHVGSIILTHDVDIAVLVCCNVIRPTYSGLPAPQPTAAAVGRPTGRVTSIADADLLAAGEVFRSRTGYAEGDAYRRQKRAAHRPNAAALCHCHLSSSQPDSG